MSVLRDASTGRLASVRTWLPPAFLIFLGVGAFGIALNNLFVPSAVQAGAVAAFAGKAYADEQLSSFDRNPWLIHSHAALGTLFVVIAAFQFWPGFRRRHARLHRIMGYVGLACLVALPTTGVASAIVYPFAGTAGIIPNAVWMVIILVSVGAAWAAIRRRDVIDHEAWVTRATAMTLGITLTRLYDPLAVLMFHMPPRQALALVFWLGSGESLLLAEVWLRRPGSPLARRLERKPARA